MKCLSCKERYDAVEAGTCRECYEEASETEEELKREIEELRAKVSFLGFRSTFTDVLLLAVDLDSGNPLPNSAPVPANKAVLASRSPVFRAMLETEMEESLSGTIKLSDVSYDALRTFVNYLYTAEACLDDDMACNLLILADKYEVKHLKTYCEKFLISKLIWETSLISYSFAHQHNAKNLIDASLSLILDNMDKLSKREEYLELVEKDPRLVVEIYEAYLSKQVNTAVVATTPCNDD
ncbi:putative chromatin remodeling & transcription regulator BTB-POZ family [Helianthus annuus]|uniref:Chromatin remodeling & transcription regulator BTB-POZ family n=1 Tax=Helianthus annuus TaxID=4232 RepID=A0A251VG66_HELAN|nr:BTB/POZ domain-containing protein At4g08455 [Helianthus annuus]KAF5818349.1 putative chromatin remodeling & transcription regulator BTB-POZ family [Helianthus annuus]KAJ0615193.1 putative chromatin remodeling & transcription regulator BTB-POZ family [Helianthus annuus]KAJ0618664.1 putative chromatin remodeling & transcription regulator BTB-POZ family [Helianthus annuus]KAJ0630152.1 putative chromatin remodeling & transcription regulator BTB-POZ family [Helianthus annuus]KAJ0777117.1 putativ